MILELCKGVHRVDLGESFPTNIWLQKSASIQPRTSPAKLARSPCTDPPGRGHERARGEDGRAAPCLLAGRQSAQHPLPSGRRFAGLQLSGSKFQSSNANSRELELTK